MAYAKTAWVNGATSVNASNLNNLESGTVINDVGTAYDKTIGGTANAITITTPNGGWSFATGKTVKGVATANSTGAVTAQVDGGTVYTVKKLDGSSYIACEADDFENNKPFELIAQNDGGDFFLLAPRGGSNIKSVQRGIATFAGWTTQTTVNYTAVDTDNTAILLNSLVVDGACSQARLGVTNFTATSFTAQKGVAGNSSTVAWQAIEFKDLKSFQRGNKSIFGTSGTQVITGVDLSKSFILFNFYTEYGLANAIGMDMRVYLTSSTQISFEVGGAGNWFVDWYVIETK